jgi:hypothetical protein
MIFWDKRRDCREKQSTASRNRNSFSHEKAQKAQKHPLGMKPRK